ncbi:MAG: non-canonical purine NTP pyrophosphatase, RdgB/HAM1 family [Rickettsiales bacterium]|nr:non-canonical purine NTP pyrophosphatase, RdgB/HAM1 family [Rickettsiales bacterium]
MKAFNKLVIASHNSGKISEINDLFKRFNIKILNSKDLKLSVPDETGTTFEQNALLKAKSASHKTGEVAISDDSGLCIDALNDQPGVYSADWAGKDRNFNVAIKKVQKLMRLKDKKTSEATMVCVLCLSWPDGSSEFFRGEAKGKIVFPPRGKSGFGYDPIFLPEIQPEKNKLLTYGELNPILKNKTSHRNKAFKDLLDKYQFLLK